MATKDKKLSRDERSRRAWCQQKAVEWILGAASSSRSFEWLLASVRRRWPESTAGSEFEDRARRAWEKDTGLVVVQSPVQAAMPPLLPSSPMGRIMGIKSAG